MLLFKPMEKLKYPKWLLLLFMASTFSWLGSFMVIMGKLLIALAIWQLPTATDWVGLWFALSNLSIVFVIWFAAKYG